MLVVAGLAAPDHSPQWLGVLALLPLAAFESVAALPGAAVAGTIVGALGTRKFEGRGSTERNSNLQARIAARVVASLEGFPVRMVSQAASRRNVTIVLRDSDVGDGMEQLHEEFFGVAKA